MAQVLRLSDDVHKEVSHYAAKREKKMTEVSDEIVRAGLAALAGSVVPPIVAVPAEEAPLALGAADKHLRRALDADTLDLVQKYRDEIAARPGKRAESLTLTETAGRLITTAWNRLVALQTHAAKR